MPATPGAASTASSPSIIVIFGITGDLAQRYLLPALYHLIKDGLLDTHTQIVGISRRDITAEQLFAQTDLCVNDVDKICDPAALKTIQAVTRMIQMDMNDPAAYAALLQTLGGIEAEQGVCMHRLYYLSIPPQSYLPVIRHMRDLGLNGSCRHGRAEARLMVEKPFGFSLDSAQELIEETSRVFKEQQTYRIDHFLAKETVQNLPVFRFQNPVFESLWSARHIAGIDINAFEQIGIEKRAQFYEPLGALRDFIQNHLLQVLALVTMERPARPGSAELHAAKQAVLRQIRPLSAAAVATHTIRGQYEGYRQEVDNAGSTTETYAAITLTIDNERWQGVPLTLRTGKAMAEKNYEIIVTFRGQNGAGGNRLRFRLQPREGIELDLLTRQPGFGAETAAAALDFAYADNFADPKHPNAYERVLLDAIRGDHALFATSDEVLASWRVIQPILDAWAKTPADLRIYQPGTRGPLPASSHS